MSFSPFRAVVQVVPRSEKMSFDKCVGLLGECCGVGIQRMYALPDGSLSCLRFLVLAVMLVGLLGSAPIAVVHFHDLPIHLFACVKVLPSTPDLPSHLLVVNLLFIIR